MAFEKITARQLEGVGVVGLADTPGLSTAEMQAKFEQTAREVVIPAFNGLVDALSAQEGQSGASGLGAYDSEGAPTTVQAHILSAANPHRVTAAQVGAASEEQVRTLIDQAVFEAGGGDMYRALYDPTGKAQDIFAYVDGAIRAAVTAALNGEV